MRKKQRIIELEAENKELQAEIVRLQDKLETKNKFDNLASQIRAVGDGGITSASLRPALEREGVPLLVDDYYGGKVFEHEATRLVSIATDGTASYYKTAKSPDKGYKYKLERL